MAAWAGVLPRSLQFELAPTALPPPPAPAHAHACRPCCSARVDMAAATDPFLKAVFNGRQMALKVSANSVYGE